MLHESEIIEQFCRAMREHDLDVSPTDIVADGKLHRTKSGNSRDKTVWYVLHADDRPNGMFGCNRAYGHDVKFTWKADVQLPPMTAAEKRAWRERLERIEAERAAALAAEREAAARRANAVWDSAEECQSHPYLERKKIGAYNLRVGRWEWINKETGEVRLAHPRALLVPIRDLKKNIHSLQAIFPSKLGDGRDKDYLADGAKEGLFHTIGRPLLHVGRMVIVICEGYATGASIHEATGHAVVVAFDAPNLLPVARAWRERFPDAIIIIAADNDQWTLKPVVNPGVTRARECEKEVGALVAIPPIDATLGKTNERGGREYGPTDFNDLQELAGHDAIRAVFDAVLNPPPEPDPGPADDEPPAWEDVPADEPPPGPDDADDAGAADDDYDGRPEDNGYFTILGYDHGKYFIFQHGQRQIKACTKGDFSDVGLIELAPLNWWEYTFPGSEKGGGINRKAAVEFIIRTAERRGIYDTSLIRGRGAWFDEGRAVYHHGGYLSVDGKRVEVTEIKSQYVYELAKSLPDPHKNRFTEEEGRKLLDLAKMFRWSKPGSAILYAGWIALAPVCGAIPWRPHLWLTGGAGSGKSTIAKLAHGLLKGTDVFAQGSSSEAGIRQRLQADALPVLMDESESTEEGDAKRIQAILALIRQASTESDAETLKGTADGAGMTFHIRSMFCLASIQVALKNKADIDRLSVLALRSGRDAKQGDEVTWKVLKETIYTFIERDPSVPGRLLRRAIDLLPTTLKNIEVFTEVAARAFGSQRDGDQYGTLLAGAWSLISSDVATPEQAQAIIDDYDWSEHLEGADEDESTRALSALMEGKIRISGVDVTVYELVCEASGLYADGVDIGKTKADAFLQRHGMRVKDGYLIVSNSSSEPRKLVDGTPYAADLRGMLLRVPGADRNDNKPLKFSGVQSKCIRVPLQPILHDSPPADGQGASSAPIDFDQEPF